MTGRAILRAPSRGLKTVSAARRPGASRRALEVAPARVGEELDPWIARGQVVVLGLWRMGGGGAAVVPCSTMTVVRLARHGPLE